MRNATGNDSSIISPVTLDHAWPEVGRLIFAVLCSFFAILMNCFFVAAFFVEDSLKRGGCCFLACLGMADLLISCGVMPVVAVVILSGQWDTIGVCHALHFLAITATYAYSLCFALVAYEEYYHLSRKTKRYTLFTASRVTTVAVIIFILSFVGAGVGVYGDMDYDYCTRAHHGNLTFRVITNVLCHFIPGAVTIIFLLASIVSMGRRAKRKASYRRSHQYEIDRCANYLNITSFLLYAASWSPYLAVVYEVPNTSNHRFYTSVWLAVSRTLLTSFLYGIFDRNFRRAFGNLFNYCFCKTTLSATPRSRRRRCIQECKMRPREVRVHIMHEAVCSNSPKRASSSRETQEL